MIHQENPNEPFLTIRLAVFGKHVAAEQICDLPRNEAGIIWDSICFAFLLLQRRVFMSYYFLHVVADIRASQILASRYRKGTKGKNKKRNRAAFTCPTASRKSLCGTFLQIDEFARCILSVAHLRRRAGVFQRGGAFPGHDSEGGESQAGGRAKVCRAAEETVRIQKNRIKWFSVLCYPSWCHQKAKPFSL